ncbi:MAG: hypothetical protein MRZ79_19395 [Bacteroidia bacterium]|nr:hypothetical protein [Bacteroidia bacterium]
MKHLFIVIMSLGLIFSPALGQNTKKPIKVEVRKEGNGFKLYRGGKPYYINGVGGQKFLDRAVSYGANSLRTWGSGEAIAVLDEAEEKGLTVLFGLWVGQERQGFDYDDSKAVKAQLEAFREVVRAYKNHPSVLLWGIGNENDLMYSDYKVWNAINDIAKMIHEEDPNHPTMTVTAGLDVAEVQLIKERAPEIDIYGINTYGGLIGIDKEIRSFGWDGPYIITEWGPNGHWEVATTKWGAPIEQTSSQKAASYQMRYEKGIYADQEKCLGSYVFLWGQKQETTPTWYGLFLESGEETEVMDVLEYCWSRKWPKNRSPHINALKIDGKEAIQNIYLQPGTTCSIMADVKDPNGDEMDYRWQILESEIGLTGTGGDAEVVPDPVKIKYTEKNQSFSYLKDNFLSTGTTGALKIKAPLKPGAYRLFVYAHDKNGNVATANAPFYVE